MFDWLHIVQNIMILVSRILNMNILNINIVRSSAATTPVVTTPVTTSDFWLDKAVIILSVILGGVATFVSTYCIQRASAKREGRKETRNAILVPLCKVTEDAISTLEFNHIYPKRGFDQHFFDIMRKMKEFCSVDQRTYIYDKRTVEILTAVIEKYNSISRLVHKNAEEMVHAYYTFIKSELFTNYYHQKLMECNFSYHRGLNVINDKAYENIIKHDKVSLLDEITQIELIYNDDPENTKKVIVDLSGQFWNEIGRPYMAGYLDKSDISKRYVEQANILDFITGIIDKANSSLDTSLNATRTRFESDIDDLYNLLKNFQEQQLKVISKVAEF